MTDVSIFLPVLNRPHNAARQVHDIMEATTTDFEIVFISTVNDVDEVNACKALAKSYSFVRHMSIPPQKVGDYAKKINAAYRESDAPWMFTGADDLHFHPGWYEAAVTAYAATGKSVVGTNDLGNRRVINGTHSTHSLVRRWYVDTHGTIDEPRKMLHEGYPHEFVDDEFIETATARDEFVHAARSVVEHMHPLWGKAPSDHLYDGQARRMAQGRRIYQRRRRQWISLSL